MDFAEVRRRLRLFPPSECNEFIFTAASQTCQVFGREDQQFRHRPATAVTNGLIVPGTFTGEIANGENIGKSPFELYEKWNVENPEDQVVLD